MPYGQTAETINPNTFPYRRKWTLEEVNELEERITKLREAMTDMVGPSGAVMYIDAGTIAHIACHLALAGGDVHPVEDDRTYIWPEKIWVDNAEVTALGFEWYLDWKIKKDHQPPPPEVDPEELERQVEAARQQIHKQLSPEVRALLIPKLAKEFERDTTDEETK